MRITIEEFFVFFATYKGLLSKDIKGLRPEIISDIVHKMQEYLPQFIDYQKKMEESKDGSGSNPKPDKSSYSVKEAAVILDKSEKTIRNWVKSGKINCSRFGNKVVFSPKDLKVFNFNLNKNIKNKYAICNQSIIIIDKKTSKLLPFEKDVLYDILDENRIWITICNRSWDAIQRLSKAEFKKNFSYATTKQITLLKYRLM